MHVCLSVRLWSWSRQNVKRQRGGGGGGRSQLDAIWWTFMMKTEEEKFCHHWGSKIKSALLKCNRSGEASEHYGVPFSFINLQIFHGCEGLFIDHGMIKWWSTVPQREPSSFSFSLPLSSLLILYLLLFLSLPRCLHFLSRYFLTLSPHPLFFISIYNILHTNLLSHSLVVREIMLDSRGFG